MKSFLAFCESPKCGAIFEVPNLIGGDGNANIHMSGTKAGPCPSCGSFGIIPDGVYHYANQTIDFLTGPETSINILKQVHAILKKAKTRDASKDEILKEVEAVSPKTAEALKKAPDTPNYLQLITVLIALIALAIQIHTSYFKGVNVEQQFKKHLMEENKELRELNNKLIPCKRKSPKIQRNDPCPCGSGKKHKKCCRLTMV